MGLALKKNRWQSILQQYHGGLYLFVPQSVTIFFNDGKNDITEHLNKHSLRNFLKRFFQMLSYCVKPTTIDDDAINVVIFSLETVILLSFKPAIMIKFI